MRLLVLVSCSWFAAAGSAHAQPATCSFDSSSATLDVHVYDEPATLLATLSGIRLFVPGLTPEATGASEIEITIAFSSFDRVTVTGTGGDDTLLMSTTGLGLDVVGELDRRRQRQR